MSLWLVYLSGFFLCLASGFICASLAKSLSRKAASEERELEARAVLPGHDCGLCGFSTCRNFAAALTRREADPGRCSPGGQVVESSLRRLFEAEGKAPMVAVVRCGGTRLNSPDLFKYSGIRDCATARSIFDGPRVCTDSCLGFGGCVTSCPVEAIAVVGDLAVVDPGRCTGCGLCVDSCPTRVIALVPADDSLYVACNSHSDPSRRLAMCDVACSACHACEKPVGAPAFTVKDGLASRTSWGIANVGEAMRYCPSAAIREIDPRKRSLATS